MNRFKIAAKLVVLNGFALLASCRTVIQNGVIPNEYVSYAQSLAGAYKGQMNGGPRGTLTIQVSGNRVSAKFSGGALLGSKCGGKLGYLTAVEADPMSRRVLSADFALSGASCVDGNAVTIKIVDQRTIRASIVQSSEVETSCPSDSEVTNCRLAAAADANHCDAGDTKCVNDADERYRACSDCSEYTHYTYVNGTFSRN